MDAKRYTAGLVNQSISDYVTILSKYLVHQVLLQPVEVLVANLNEDRA